MGFKVWHLAKLLFAVLLCGNLLCATQETDGRPRITVLLLNRAGVPRDILNRCESEANRIFRAAGIEIAWNDCFVTHQCHHAPGPDEFVLSIVPDGRSSSDLAYGVAFLDPAGNGKYADIFYRRMQNAYSASGGNLAELMGTVAAHELGHLQLGSHGHSAAGVMLPVWKEKTLQSIEMGSLLFTGTQASVMKARIGSVSAVRATTEFTLVRGLREKP